MVEYIYAVSFPNNFYTDQGRNLYEHRIITD